MRRVTRGLLAVVAWAVLGACSGAEAQTAAASGKIPFEEVRARMLRAYGAKVSSVCGTGTAPWVRSRGASPLRIRTTARMDRGWTRTFVTTLLRSADWDEVSSCPGRDVPCDGDEVDPLILVTLLGIPETQVLLHFDGDCAQAFDAVRPLGAMHIAERENPLLAQVRGALHYDARVKAMNVGGRSADPDTLREEDLPPGDRPKLKKRVTPIYPNSHSIEGEVVVQALVGKDGLVHEAWITRSVPLLDESALTAVRQWEYIPGRLHGRPVYVWVTISVRYTLEK